jgi:hypothetical protein
MVYALLQASEFDLLFDMHIARAPMQIRVHIDVRVRTRVCAPVCFIARPPTLPNKKQIRIKNTLSARRRKRI